MSPQKRPRRKHRLSIAKKTCKLIRCQAMDVILLLICFHRNMFTESLPSNESIRHSVIWFLISSSTVYQNSLYNCFCCQVFTSITLYLLLHFQAPELWLKFTFSLILGLLQYRNSGTFLSGTRFVPRPFRSSYHIGDGSNLGSWEVQTRNGLALITIFMKI
jgi:hypothetical protein